MAEEDAGPGAEDDFAPAHPAKRRRITRPAAASGTDFPIKCAGIADERLARGGALFTFMPLLRVHVQARTGYQWSWMIERILSKRSGRTPLGASVRPG
jgi:hypothetical protein